MAGFLNSQLISSELEPLINPGFVAVATKVANREEWMREKWNRRRGYLKIHFAVDIVIIELTMPGKPELLGSKIIQLSLSNFANAVEE
jgi:hypothetical protein